MNFKSLLAAQSVNEDNMLKNASGKEVLLRTLHSKLQIATCTGTLYALFSFLKISD